MADSLQFILLTVAFLCIAALDLKIRRLNKDKPKYAVGDKVIYTGDECVIEEVVDTTGDVVNPTRWMYSVGNDVWYTTDVLESSLKRAE